MTVRLHIGRLVVEGLELTSADAARLQAAIADELTARLADADPARWAGFSAPKLAVSPLAAAAEAGPEALGRRVGAALYGGLLP